MLVKLIAQNFRSRPPRALDYAAAGAGDFEFTAQPPSMTAHSTSVSRVALARIQKLSPLRPHLALVLGSGFGHVLQKLTAAVRVPYSRLPGFPKPGVAGHAGELLIGKLGGTPVLVLNGRAHYYEGHSMEQVTLGIRTLAALGVKDVLLTNAAGGLNPKFRAGDFMRLTDHINLMGVNPLRGPASKGLPRFVDLTRAYDAKLSGLLVKAAQATRVKLQRGVYLAVSGPTYETPAEIRAFASLGVDAVGMSTVPETIVARQHGLRVAALSCITNLGAGLGSAPLSHEEVLETAARVKPAAATLLETFAKLYGSVR